MTPTTQTTLRFTGDWPFWPVLGTALVLGLLMWLLYRREIRFHPDRGAWIPAAARSLAVVLLVLGLAGPVLRHETVQRQLGRVIIALDASESMRLTDSDASKSRWQRMEEAMLKGEKPLLKQIADKSDVEVVALRGSQIQRLWWHRNGGKDTSGVIPTSLAIQPDSPRTDLDSTLKQALGPAAAGTALVMFTDGQHNTQGSPEELSQALKSSAVPVFPVGMGVEVSPPDLSIAEVTAPESVFGEEVMRGRVTVQDLVPAGLPGLIKIEGAAGIQLSQETFTTNGRGERSFEFSFPVKLLPAPTIGDKNLRVCSITVAVAGEKSSIEKTRANNAAELAFHVLEKRRKLLILDGRARWETRYVHNHFDRDKNWEVTLAFDNYKSGNENALVKAFPKDEDTLMGYDLVVIGDITATKLGAERLKWLKNYVELRGGGLVFIDGARGEMKSWSNSEAGALVPVSWTAATTTPTATLMKWELQPDAERYPALRLSESASANLMLWPTLPEARWSAITSARPAAVTLAKLGGNPALVFQNTGAGAVLYLASDELWRWRYQVADLYHQRLWVQIASWVAAPPFQAESGLTSLGTDRLRYRAGEQAELRVRLKGPDGKLVRDAQPRVTLLRDGKETATLQMEPDTTHAGVYRALSPPLKSGEWTAQVGSEPKLTLRVSDGGNQELSALTLNRSLLETMARNTSGRFLREEQTSELPDLLQAIDRKQVTVTETILWSSWWWLAAVILLLTIEWLMRRKLRLI
ncbi:MAG: hypothetical protein JNJ83_05385 [Verrucomicrobiaceae bacterium]|nr:hypothetical protein [Verrucomicrobiaceae bacterium]